MFKQIKNYTFFFLFLGVGVTATAQTTQPVQPEKMQAQRPAVADSVAKVVRAKPASPSIGGKWQSVANPALFVTFSGNKMTQTDGGTVTQTGKVQFDKQCKNISCMKMGDNKKHGCFTVSAQFDISCYQILKLTNKELIYQGFGSEDQPQAFKRVK